MNPTSTNPYLEALSQIPKGETRSFQEIARLAGRPSAARAAGRAISSSPAEAKIPWHRAVNAQGALSIDPSRADAQMARLRADGARPREGESVARWAKRVKAAFVGLWRGRRFVAVDDERLIGLAPAFVERFESAGAARERGFVSFDEPKAVEVATSLSQAASKSRVGESKRGARPRSKSRKDKRA